MKTINAVQLRQSVTKVLALLKKEKKPILLKKGSEDAAVIITIEDYKKRFVDVEAESNRKKAIQDILNAASPSAVKTSAEDIIDELRGGGAA